ncbi:hypothetical protein VH441_00635 [Psychrobacter sp. HD31]|uniref:hypothetical protein n=1 Tax=Psychrobacter sp. HD31 TaxID=3112003 RepID=UPI003DA262AE
MSDYISIETALHKLRLSNPSFQMIDLYNLYFNNQIDICFNLASYGFLVTDDFYSHDDINKYLEKWNTTTTELKPIGGYFSATGWHGYSETIKNLLMGITNEVYCRYAVLMNEEAKKTSTVFMPFEYTLSFMLPNKTKPSELPKDIIKGAKLTKDTIFIPNHQVQVICQPKLQSTSTKEKSKELIKPSDKLNHKSKSSYLKLIHLLLDEGGFDTKHPYTLYQKLKIHADTHDIDFISKDTFKKVIDEAKEYRSN